MYPIIECMSSTVKIKLLNVFFVFNIMLFFTCLFFACFFNMNVLLFKIIKNEFNVRYQILLSIT